MWAVFWVYFWLSYKNCSKVSPMVDCCYILTMIRRLSKYQEEKEGVLSKWTSIQVVHQSLNLLLSVGHGPMVIERLGQGQSKRMTKIIYCLWWYISSYELVWLPSHCHLSILTSISKYPGRLSMMTSVKISHTHLSGNRGPSSWYIKSSRQYSEIFE